MRILHVNSYYGAGRFYKHLYDRQTQSGLDITVFTPVSSDFNPKGFDYGPYTVIRANHHHWQRFSFTWKHQIIWADMERKIDLSKYDLCHAHSLFSNGYLAARFKRLTGKPFIVHIRSTDIDFFFAKMKHLRRVGMQILEQADYLLFLSPASRDRLFNDYCSEKNAQEFTAKSRVVPNGLDPFWNAHPGDVRKSHGVLSLLYVGDVNRNKNIEVILKAMEILTVQGVDVQLTVVGPAGDPLILKRIVQNPRVRYVPPQPKEKLISIYREHDIFVMASLRETFGLVYAEALSQGLPVLYSQGQGFDKQFPEGHVGFSVNPLQADTVAEGIDKILADYEGLAQRSLEAARRFDWDLVAADIQEVYDQVLRNNRGTN